MEVCSKDKQADPQIPDPHTSVWPDLTYSLSSSEKEFVVLTADAKSGDGATYGSTLGAMFLERNSEILNKFITFCQEHYTATVEVPGHSTTTENKCGVNVLNTEVEDYNIVKHPAENDSKHANDNDHNDINDTQLHQDRTADESMEITVDAVASSSNACTLEEEDAGDENIEESDEKGKSTSGTTELNGKSGSEALTKVKSRKVQKGRRTLAKEKHKENLSEKAKTTNTQTDTANVRRSSRLARDRMAGRKTKQAGQTARKETAKRKLKVSNQKRSKKDNADHSCPDRGISATCKPDSVECPACGDVLNNQESFVKHVMSDHELEKKSRRNAKKITWTADSKKCSICGQITESEGVNSHIFVHCFDVLKYPCNRCSFVFLRLPDLVSHRKKEHGGTDDDDMTEKDGEGAVKESECQECGLKYSTPALLQEHMQISHKPKNSDWECELCSLHFKTRPSFKRHLKCHTALDNNIIKCNICEKRFSEKEDLKNHMMAHQRNEKNYKCDSCDKVFKSRSGRRMHRIFTHGDKGLKKYGRDKFECRYCGGILGSHHTLVRHEARHEQNSEDQIQKMGSFVQMQSTCKDISLEELRVKEPETKTEDVPQSSETNTNGNEAITVLETNNGVQVNEKEISPTAQTCEETPGTNSQDKRDSEEKTIECKVCQMKFTSQQLLKEHGKIHSIAGKSPYACDLCGKIFLRSLSLYKHRQLHDTSGKFTCKTCQKQFNSIESLRRHAKNHLDVKPYICSVCGKGCTEKRNLDTHMLVHTQKKEFICEVCGKAYRTQQQLKEHGYIHTGERPHKCKVCEMAFRSQDVLRNHMAIHSEFKKFMCHTCGKTFRQQSCLITHQHTHSNEPTHRCNVCGQGCKSSGALNSHFVSFHLKLEDVPSYKWSVHVCKVCNKMFGEKQDHERHMRTHTGEKPYSCDICQKTFSDKSNLRSHIRNHNGDRSKKCHICGKGFMFNRDLKKHLASHNNKIRVPLLDNVTMETALQETIVPAVDNIVTVITQTEALPRETHDPLVPSVTESYEMVTSSLPLGSNLTTGIPPSMNTDNIGVSLMQEATMVHMGVYTNNNADLTWHSL